MLRVEGSCEAEDVECLRVDVVVRLRVVSVTYQVLAQSVKGS